MRPVEPLLPVEKKLIGWSLGMGLISYWAYLLPSITSSPIQSQKAPARIRIAAVVIL